MTNFDSLPPEVRNMIYEKVRRIEFKRRVDKLMELYTPRVMEEEDSPLSNRIHWSHIFRAELHSSFLKVEVIVSAEEDYIVIESIYRIYCPHLCLRQRVSTAWVLYGHQREEELYESSCGPCHKCETT